jgi:hypothetical protein
MRGSVQAVAASIAIATALMVVGSSTAGAAVSGPFHYGWGETRVSCITANGEEYAHVTSSMWVHNRGIGSGWVTNFRLKARLVKAEGAGINLGRSWRTHRFPVRSDLNQDSDYFSPMAVNTDVMSIHEEWKVQVKQVWDRKAPWHDLVREFFLTFNTSHCKPGRTHTPIGQTPPATPGAMVPEAPQS